MDRESFTTILGRLHIDAVPILKTNYVWIIRHADYEGAYLLDPGDAAPLKRYLTKNAFPLKQIIMTHSHWDHIDGLDEMLQWQKVDVIGPECSAIPQVTIPVEEGCRFLLWDTVEVQVIHTPGHLPEHLCYFLPNGNQPVVFSGDIIFSAGCGRIFNGTHEELFNSIQRLNALPSHTQVCCSHDYIMDNMEFAKHVEPDNPYYQERIKSVILRKKMGKAAIPTSIQAERLINPFLRCGEKSIKQNAARFSRESNHPVGIPTNDLEVFTVLRDWKNQF